MVEYFSWLTAATTARKIHTFSPILFKIFSFVGTRRRFWRTTAARSGRLNQPNRTPSPFSRICRVSVIIVEYICQREYTYTYERERAHTHTRWLARVYRENPFKFNLYIYTQQPFPHYVSFRELLVSIFILLTPRRSVHRKSGLVPPRPSYNNINIYNRLRHRHRSLTIPSTITTNERRSSPFTLGFRCGL